MGSWSALKSRVAEYFRERIVIYALVISLFAIGFSVGAAGVGSVDVAARGELSEFVASYVEQAAAGGLEPVPSGAARLLAELVRGALIPWILGLSVIGVPIALGLVFLRGFAVGFTVRLLIEEYSLNGALLGLVSVLPHGLFGVFGLCLAAGAALTFAVGASKLLLGRAAGESVFGHLATATLLCAVAGSCIAVGAWIQGNVTPVLVGLAARWLSL